MDSSPFNPTFVPGDDKMTSATKMPMPTAIVTGSEFEKNHPQRNSRAGDVAANTNTDKSRTPIGWTVNSGPSQDKIGWAYGSDLSVGPPGPRRHSEYVPPYPVNELPNQPTEPTNSKSETQLSKLRHSEYVPPYPVNEPPYSTNKPPYPVEEPTNSKSGTLLPKVHQNPSRTPHLINLQSHVIPEPYRPGSPQQRPQIYSIPNIRGVRSGSNINMRHVMLAVVIIFLTFIIISFLLIRWVLS